MNIRRSIAFNIMGIAAPLMSAVICIPVLIAYIGPEKFGIYSLLMAGAAYVALLDLGFSVAVTYRLSAIAGRGQFRDQMLSISRVAITAVLFISFGLTALFLILSQSITYIMSGSPRELVSETLSASRILILSMPFVLTSTLLCGILAAHRKFDQINVVRAPIGALTYILPALMSIFSPSLIFITIIFLTLRVITFLAHLRQCQLLMPELTARLPAWDAVIFRELIGFGGWLTVSNMIGPIMATLDRFYIGHIRDAANVAKYVAPYEIASRLSLIPGSLLPVFFPILVSMRPDTEDNMPDLLNLLSAWMALVCVVPAMVLSILSPFIFRSWMEGVFSGDSVYVLQILAAGIFINCVALVYFYQIQARGRTDLIAKIHIAEVVPYLILLWYLTTTHGIIGTAIAWMLRVACDGLVMCLVANRDTGSNAKTRAIFIYAGVLFASLPIAGVSYFPTAFLLLIIPVLVAGLFWPFLKTTFTVFPPVFDMRLNR